MTPLKIALVASEATPFAKTGGLADVVSALARALHRQGHDVRVFLPLYGRMSGTGFSFTPVEGLQDLELEFPGGKVRYSVRTAPLPNSAREDGEGALQVEFIDCPELYHRDSFYTDEADEPVRWATLSRAVIEVCQHTAWAPDIVHCNDWHTGLIPLYLKKWYGWDKLFAGTRSLLSIHNIGYQGTFPASVIEQLGLEEARELFHQEHLEEGYVSFLEMGLLHASWLSTVSRTYAREIQGKEYGMGLQDLLQARDDHLEGIVNGIDVDEWSPSKNPLLPHPYSAQDLSGKARMKASLLERMGLPVPEGRGPMVAGIVSRMTGQKGFELLPDLLPVLLRQDDFRLVVLGSGEQNHEDYFNWLQETYPDKVAVKIGYDAELSHWIEAGSDLFLMPSRYEPCGLNQMYSLRYGCVPLVRKTGGLADTVEAWNGAAGTGTGFVFEEFTSEALFQALTQALQTWQDPEAWGKLVQNGMAQDFSWEQQSAHYVTLYRRILQD
ncbi:MAG: starch synthase [Planctomycetota bacterium]|jgi:starch synthase